MIRNKTHLFNAKQSQTMSLQALVSILLTVIIIIFSISVINNNSEQLASSAQDVSCRAFLGTYDTLAGRTGATAERVSAQTSFFGELTKYCKTERLLFESREEEEVFNRYAQASRSCYERYGSGELRFLDFTQRKGSYCFVCAEVEFENVEGDETQTYSYKDLGRWMEEKIPRDSNENEKSYRELSNLLYIDLLSTGGDLEAADQIIQKDKESYSDEQKMTYKSLESQYLYLRSMYNRELSVQEKTYVVYRYENGDDLYNPLIPDVALGSAAGISGAAVGKYGFRKVSSFILKRGACYGTAAAVSLTGVGVVIGGGIAATCAALTVGSGIVTAATIYDLYTDDSTLARDAQKLTSVFTFPGVRGEISQEEISLMNKIQDLTKKEELSSEDIEFIPQYLVQDLAQEQKADFINIGQGDTLEDEQKIKTLLTGLLVIQSQNAISSVETPNFKQYVEILPQGEFYNQCGAVPNSLDN